MTNIISNNDHFLIGILEKKQDLNFFVKSTYELSNQNNWTSYNLTTINNINKIKICKNGAILVNESNMLTKILSNLDKTFYNDFLQMKIYMKMIY